MDKIPNLDRRFRWFRIKLWKADKTSAFYYFRSMTTNELNVTKSKDRIEAENYMLDMCVIPPEETDWNTLWSGTVVKLIECIYTISGLTEESIPQHEALEWLKSDDGGAEAIAISMIAGLDLTTLRNSDMFDYCKYIFVGKMMFESMYGQKAEAAFGSGRPKGVEDYVVPPEGNPYGSIDPRNPRAVVSEGGFNYKRGR